MASTIRITIRNITLPQPQSRARRPTIDDDALPNTYQSPTKTLARRETKVLEHSASSSDLKITNETSPRKIKSGLPEVKITSPSKDQIKRHRRESTIEWSNATPQERQRKLEDVAAGRLVDSFFSLHVKDFEDPIYVSEIVEKAMNPNFRLFDFNGCSPSITRHNEVTVKLWAKNNNNDKHRQLTGWTVALPALQYVGKSLETFNRTLPPNCILVHLSDGIYTGFTNFRQEEIPIDLETTSQKQTSPRTLPSASYETLMRLSTLDDCIQDALATREKLTGDINKILDDNRSSFDLVSEVGEAHESLESTKRAVEAETRLTSGAQKKRDNLQASIRARRELIAAGRKANESARLSMDKDSQDQPAKHDAKSQIAEDTRGQRRRICEDLLSIYPIDALQDRSLAFRIRGLYLPNSENLDDSDAEIVAAALGHAAQVVHLLCFYLSVPLPYPVEPYASRSTVQDPISIMKGNESRTFPLFSKGAVRYRFEYGVFLLNKDIEILLQQFGLRVMDIRQTLPNLKYLLYVATAGKGELPTRKAGGVRGLIRSASAQTTPSLSREGSGGSEEGEGAKVGYGKGKGLLVDVANGKMATLKPPPKSAFGSLQGVVQRGATTQSSKLRDISR